jgi:predicted DNA-binding transcriptional regulator AlpA
MSEPTRWLPTNALAQRFDKTPRTIANWEKTRPNNFPLPTRVNRRKLWRESEINEWERGLIASMISEAR